MYSTAKSQIDIDKLTRENQFQKLPWKQCWEEMSRPPSCDYVAYIIHAPEDKDWVLDTVVHNLEGRPHRLKCAIYDRDCYVGAVIFDEWKRFIETSDHIIVVLSPNVVKIPEAKFQLFVAVNHCIEKGVRKLIPLIKKCAAPSIVTPFKAIDMSQDSWWRTLVDRLKTKPVPICRGDEVYINLAALRPLPERNAISDPGKQALALPEHVFRRLKTADYQQKRQMPFEQELQRSNHGRRRYSDSSFQSRYSHTTTSSQGKRSSSDRDSNGDASTSKRVHEEQEDPNNLVSNYTSDGVKHINLENIDPRVLRTGDSAVFHRQRRGERQDDCGDISPEGTLDPRAVCTAEHALSRRQGRRKQRKQVNVEACCDDRT